MKVYLLLLSLSCFFILSTPRPDGAPKSACSSLKPVHNGIAAQRTSPPYTVEVERRRGNSFRITIKSPLNDEFQGFIVQARSYNDKTRFIDGEFKPRSNNAKPIDCFNREKSTLTQIDANPKTEIVADWYSRVTTDERIIFRATVAKSFAVFWTEIDSKAVTIKSSKQMVTKQLSSSERPNNLYEDCFTDKGCFGLPEGCVQNTDCEVLFTYSKSPEGLQYSMHGTLDPKMYMAMALSQDNLMGDDKVTECIRVDSNDIILRESYNEGKRNSRTNEIPKDGYVSFHANGISSCYWTSPYEIEDNGKHYDFKKHAYYILLAKGSVENGRLRYHDDRIASAQSVNFTAFLAVAGENVADSIKIHGTFMVTAWVGFVSIAILLARHFKNTWENSTLGGVKIWFALHRLFMVTAMVFFSIAFIVIFIYKNGWNYQTSNPHAILGCIAVALGILNPIMALFRPAPDSKKRPIFNWLHWSVGNAAHIIAIITIFFAVSLPSSGLKNSFYWVMAVFVIVHLIFHLLYQAHIWTQTTKKNNDLSMNEMNGARSNAHNGQNAQAKNVSANVFRILLLGIYSVFLFVILIALYALIGVA